MIRLLSALILSAVITTSSWAKERDFYLPNGPNQDNSYQNERDLWPFQNLNSGRVGDYQNAYAQWIDDIARFEGRLAGKPDVSDIAYPVDQAAVLMHWHEQCTADLLYLARGYRWLDESGNRVVNRAPRDIKNEGVDRTVLTRWYRSTYKGLSYAVERMSYQPRDYPILTLVITGSLDANRHDKKRLWAERKLKSQLHVLKQRVGKASGYLRTRSTELRKEIELVNMRQKQD